MKKLILTLCTVALLIGTIFTSCNTAAAEKVDNAENKSIRTDEDFNIAKEEYLEDIENFKKETTTKIKANNRMISEFNVKIEYAKKDAKAYYQEQTAILEQKNIAMKKKLDEYEVTGKDNWETFKVEFSRDMDDLGEAFKNFTIKNE